jgi:hypothetical protein
MTEQDRSAASAQLANEMRRIIERLTISRPPAEELAQAAAAAAAFADRLDALALRQSSWEISEAGLLPGDFVAYSPVSGTCNAIAPPVKLYLAEGPDGETAIVGDVTFGAAYEGPPGHVHGGMVAAMFDELLGFAQLGPGFTASLTIHYRRPTPLNRQLRLWAAVERVEGRKRYIRGTCELEGEILTEAEGLFIAPKSDGDFLARLGLGGPAAGEAAG